MDNKEMTEFDNILAEIDTLSDGAIDHLMAATPWQGDPAGDLAPVTGKRPIKDEDGFSMTGYGAGDYNYKGFSQIQDLCWQKFQDNPFVFTTVIDITGRLTGYGFQQNSTYPRANEFMEEIWEDPRNNLVQNFGKYIARSVIQGELFLSLTVHKDGFVEVDFVSPSVIKGFENNSGILMAKNKPLFPLMYRVQGSTGDEKFIPSINLAYYPELWKEAIENKHVKKSKIVGIDAGTKFKDLNGCQTYMVRWDQGFVTDRNVGRVRASLEWIEHYSNIKKWELDHKKSSGAYLWTIEIEDRQSFRMWLAMSDEERAQTGLLKKKVPGGTIMLPPGFKMQCNNPKLSSITNQDNDILKMISAGLNMPEDVLTGSSSGTTFSGAKLSRGPASDRLQDQISDLDRFLVHGFWRGAMWLHSKINGMPWEYKIRRAYKFEEGDPKFKNFKVKAHKTVQINYPISEMGDLEGKSRAFLGVKHGPVTEQLGMSGAEVSKHLGFQNYNQSRLDKATEDDMYPELKTSAEIEAGQEGGDVEGALTLPAVPKPAAPAPAKPVKKEGSDET